MSDAAQKPPAPDRGMRWVLIMIVVSLVWYLLADRFTPYTQQARLQAYVVPVAAEVAGQIKRVAVGNNQEVRQGDVLFELTRSSTASPWPAPKPTWTPCAGRSVRAQPASTPPRPRSWRPRPTNARRARMPIGSSV